MLTYGHGGRLKAIAEPHRRGSCSSSATGSCSAGEIASHFDVTRPAVSQHLSVLKEAGLVSERERNQAPLPGPAGGAGRAEAFLDEFWDERLEALKREAEREERKKDGKHD